jgi:hypothetical protein
MRASCFSMVAAYTRRGSTCQTAGNVNMRFSDLHWTHGGHCIRTNVLTAQLKPSV